MTTNKFSRKASPGKYRVMGYDQYDYSDYFIDEFTQPEQALCLLKQRASSQNGSPASFSDWYFIYNDRGEALYKAHFEQGITQLQDI